MQILEALNESGEWKGQAFRVVFHLLNYTSRDNPEFYWSFAEIGDRLKIDRELVAGVFGRLQERGFVRDTGERRGRFKDVAVWQVDWEALAEWSEKTATRENKQPEKPATSSRGNPQQVAVQTRSNPPPLIPLHESKESDRVVAPVASPHNVNCDLGVKSADIISAVAKGGKRFQDRGDDELSERRYQARVEREMERDFLARERLRKERAAPAISPALSE